MDLNKLKIFYTLAGTKSYTRCADRLYLTQSAVSHAIKKLETDLGFNLIDRANRQFRLTRQGEFLSTRCAGIFDCIEETLEYLAQEAYLPISITLGAPVEFGSSVLIKGMTPFLKKHTYVHMDFDLRSDLLPSLLTDKLNLVVDCVPHIHQDLVVIPLLREEYVVIATPQYIKDKKIVTMKDLRGCNLLSFDRNLGWWKNFINALDHNADFGFDFITTISSVRGIINGTLESLGVGFVPRYTVLRELKQGELNELFPEIETLNDQINIYLKKRNYEKKIFRDLIRHIKSLTLT
ncbi:DNA-binding transcriptional regulator, LysR family [Desulfocicer vacuolatum DSM 3385]|uniref:DNA-binding transcriptional regulator, LysR family n=1 Tax=Desulfocicer vacuolatum DSM 3385 TaxID=1121400 RepID=A0A1W1YTG9_9BACT|nr:LysR family transcriptional regulator [Desulfocicer vacuolatum]SMC39008.1 DNA-binding transcriptional regulator, LysR family [Desulfocicer vacuolatum DSM 3385]